MSLMNVCYHIRKKYFVELIRTGKIKKIEPSDVWYEERKDFSVDAIGTKRDHAYDNGFVLLTGEISFLVARYWEVV